MGSYINIIICFNKFCFISLCYSKSGSSYLFTTYVAS